MNNATNDAVLIANRGEIALRVIGTCRRMGLPTVAIHTDADRDAPHVRAADRSVAVPAYLDIDAVVAAAEATGARLIHPGYGFLSERAEFARAVAAAGLTLIGPPAEVMDRMGRKDAAREIAEAAGVPVVPRGDQADYPILVKAAAGGGGKGMRIVASADEREEAIAAAKREALAAFGDDTVLIEKYVERGRHIEVQILADHHGSVVHLFERDCSTQRRHQKVVEEAPAPTLTVEQRAAITHAAVSLAREVGYRNAGTVEFLLDDDTGHAYFLEMNTRLQVEHPVTESVVRVDHAPLDLVEQQIRVSRGEPLPFTQAQVTLDGHALEARVYAEDAFGGFLPQAGTATLVHWPPTARVDHALWSGQVVGTSFDPMLGKVIVHGHDRDEAIRLMIEALDETAILGLTTNTGFLRALIDGPAFRDAAIDTAWLDHHQVAPPDRELPLVIAAWAQARQHAADTGHPFQIDGFRAGGPAAGQVVELDRPVMVDRSAGLVDDRSVAEVSATGAALEVRVDGIRHRAMVEVGAHTVEVALRGQRHLFERPDPFGDHAVHLGDGAITAPMPGSVLAVDVAAGDQVRAGDRLGLLEAMKMELALTAPFDGVVSAVNVAPGDQVALGAPLFSVEPAAGDIG